ncbi:alanine racemase [Neiella marina]|uniref:Alanine racemase n=1 Tax=Neiella holothuriorum TaxID=2870530 RepID=A0ABS7EGJ1_9GAMM|nr:alanine racemase [Neiella holothuriorum]MBW8191048.1 alanine racemase [Neiella holothuriorum]
MEVAVATIHTKALAHNLAQVRRHAPNLPVMAMLKANAYGHGLLDAAHALASAEAFGVARLHEAVSLREAGFQHRIVLLEGFFDAKELALISTLSLDVVVHQRWQLEALEQVNELDKPIAVWLKIDSGMHRIGVEPEHASKYLARLQACLSVRADINLMTHFACADDLHNTMTQQQQANFEALYPTFAEHTFGGDISLANSAAIVAHSSSHQGWLRPGIMLYGASPMQLGVAADHQLQAVMTLTSKVIAVRDLAEGEPVGYGARWRTDKATRIAVVAMGYGDGYPRHAADGTPVVINGRRYPLAGRVSMDMLTVDVGNADINVGDAVELWGQQLPADEVARASDTIAYELFCGITRRVKYQYR